jgi:hypothetical protein
MHHGGDLRQINRSGQVKLDDKFKEKMNRNLIEILSTLIEAKASYATGFFFYGR